MPIQLTNSNNSLTIQLPQENYNFSRFDWCGQIIDFTYNQDYTFTTTELPAKDSLKKSGRGFQNEFGIVKVIGYNDCPKNGLFPKIGVGWLKKKGGRYNFFRRYPVKPFTTEWEHSNTEFTITSNSGLYNGYSFTYLKNIQLSANGFIVKYQLKNTGSKRMITNEYCHNFVSLNRQKLDKNQELRFNFELNKSEFSALVNPKEFMTIEPYSFIPQGRLRKQFFFGDISGGKEVTAEWELIHHKDKIGLREKPDFKTSSINIWGRSHVISPEIFYEIDLKPGEETSWSRSYEVFTL